MMCKPKLRIDLEKSRQVLAIVRLVVDILVGIGTAYMILS